MKIALTTIAAVALVFLGSTPQVEARGHRTTVYVSSYMPCGTPVYRERYCSGYDRWGNPVWATRGCRPPYRPVRRPVVCRPVVRPVYVAPCPPPHYASPYRRSGFEARVTYSR